jgi:hypothetical protein
MKMQVIVNGISFYTSKRALRERRVGSDSNLNVALSQVYENLFNAVGISTTISLYDHKMKQHTYDIQMRKL